MPSLSKGMYDAFFNRPPIKIKKKCTECYLSNPFINVQFIFEKVQTKEIMRVKSWPVVGKSDNFFTEYISHYPARPMYSV